MEEDEGISMERVDNMDCNVYAYQESRLLIYLEGLLSLRQQVLENMNVNLIVHLIFISLKIQAS